MPTNVHVILGDRPRAVRQNAEQILRLVRDAFPSNSIQSHKDAIDCMAELSDGELLSCLWSEALRTAAAGSKRDASDVTDAMTRVRRAMRAYWP